MRKRTAVFLPILVILAMLASLLGMAAVMAQTPPGANTNNVEMSLTPLPNNQQAGGSISFYVVVTNPQSVLYPVFQSADAVNMTLTLYLSQADGTPSPTGTVVGNISYLAVNAPAVVFGPLAYTMPVLNPGVFVATYKAVLSGTILLGPPLPFNIDKYAGVTLIDWTIDKSASVPGGSVNVAGETITYTVVITNTGGAWLQGSLNDTLPGIYGMSGPVESGTVDGYVQPGETWTYTYYYDAKQSDINSNGINKYGVADGDGDIDNEATFTDNFEISKSDAAEVPILLNPCIDIEKLVSVDGGTTWLDADNATGPSTPVGSDVKFKVVVTNCGNVGLTGIVVGDTDFTFTGVATTLAATASDESDIVTIAAVEGQQYDLADVTGTPPVGSSVTDSDPAYYITSAEVGGTAFPVDKLMLLAPWGALAGFLGALAFLVLRKKREA
jgi:uncharacterized repeat protein (TIGR01451 family)